MTKITTIIFDLGGVILNLDQDKTLRAFSRLGVELEDIHSNNTVFGDFEIGKINADDFRQCLITELKGQATPEQIDHAWNAMLLDLPAYRLEMIKQLRKRFKVLLLSNTNSIHIGAFHAYLNQTFPELDWMNLFDKVYYSYEIGYRKPNTDIYEFVLKQHNLQPHQALFIDDNKGNLNGAAKVGLHTLWAKNPLDQHMLDEIEEICTAFTASMN